MGFTVVEQEIRTIWVPLGCVSADTADTFYEGQLVMSNAAVGQPAGEGLGVYGAGAGHSDATGKNVPFGVILAFNDANPLYSSTYKGQYCTSVTTQAQQLARDFRGVEGMFGKGDPQPFAKVAVIGPSTILKAPIYLAAYGTAPTVYTNTTADSTGATITTSATTMTPVTYNTTWYCRSGANKGLYRVAYSTSTTSHTFYVHWPYAIAAGDTFVPVCARPFGTSLCQFDTESTFLQAQPTTGTDDVSLDILDMNLEVAGQEYATFKFNADHFCAIRA
jgi:hypothetical protein